MDRFWEESWASIDPERIEAYAKTFATEPDAVMRILHAHSAVNVCDAGCGCGLYAIKLAANGFTVSGFDISSQAVAIAQKLLRKADVPAALKAASVSATGYTSEQFDGVICRDVLDHMTKAEAKAALTELIRITRKGGVIIATVDTADEEYLTEPHTVTPDGDFLYIDGKWRGMTFHLYSKEELFSILPTNIHAAITHSSDGLLLQITK